MNISLFGIHCPHQLWCIQWWFVGTIIIIFNIHINACAIDSIYFSLWSKLPDCISAIITCWIISGHFIIWILLQISILIFILPVLSNPYTILLVKFTGHPCWLISEMSSTAVDHWLITLVFYIIHERDRRLCPHFFAQTIVTIFFLIITLMVIHNRITDIIISDHTACILCLFNGFLLI